MANQVTRYQGDPLSREYITRANIERMLLDKFYALIPEDVNTLAAPGQVVEFNPSQSCFCIKSLVIHRMSQEQFDDLKGREMMRSSFGNGQTMAITFYNPENILKRMNFHLTEQQGAAAGQAGGEPNNPSPADGNKTAGQ
jgi:hypothetical protein